jgi:hypothetical protein
MADRKCRSPLEGGTMSDATSELWTLKDMLAEMRSEFPTLHQLPRCWAAEVFESVGSDAALDLNLRYSAREVAWALVRVYGAFDQTDLQKLSKGYVDASEFYSRVSIPTDWVLSASAEVLISVGENIAWGNSNSGHAARTVGWALAVIFGVSNEEAAEELTQGYLEALAYYYDGTLPDDLRQ